MPAAVTLFGLALLPVGTLPNPVPGAVILLTLVMIGTVWNPLGGLLSLPLLVGYLLYFFSTPGAPFVYSDVYRLRLGAWLVLAPGAVALIAYLRYRADYLSSSLIETLRRSEQRYRQLFDSTPTALWVLDPDTHAIRSANEAAIRGYGYSLAEFRGMTLGDLTADDEAKRVSALSLDGPREPGTALRHRTKHGAVIDVELTTARVDVDQEPALLVSATDVTQRTRAESGLADRERTLRTIVDNAPHCMKLVDRELRLIRMNPAGLALIEADSLDQVQGQSLVHLVEPAHREAFQRLTERTFEGDTGSLEFAIVGLRGGRRWLETHAVPLRDDRGRIIAMLGLTRDVTEQKRLTDELRASRESLHGLAAHLLAAREAERAAVAREIHDELGQALTALKMDVNWLGRHARQDAQLDARLRSMTDLLDATLKTVQRVSAGLRPDVLDNLGLAAAVEWQAREIEQRTPLRCIVTTQVGEQPLEPEVATSVFRICQEALTNIVRHAHATTVRVWLGERNGRLELEVRDDGRGIAPQALRATHSYGLLGMRERAALLDGELTVSSEAGAGTVVRLRVPLARRRRGA